MLGGTILEFCSRYQSLISSLEKHDKERIFLNVVESGVFGKVFSLLAGPADSIRQNRDLTLTRSQMSEEGELEAEPRSVSAAPSGVAEEVAENGLSESARRLFVNTFTRRKKEEEPKQPESRTEETDPLSLAFAKSFGTPESKPAAEPHFETPQPEMKAETPLPVPEIVVESRPSIETPTISAPSVVDIAGLEQGFLSAQERIAGVKKEWEETKWRDLSVNNASDEEEGMPEPKVGNDDDYSYPFGGWTNADKYNQ